MTDYAPVGRCTYPGCIFRWRDGHDRPCNAHVGLLAEPQALAGKVNSVSAWVPPEAPSPTPTDISGAELLTAEPKRTAP